MLVSTRRIRALHRRLLKQQGEFRPKPRLPILDELIATVLSQATSDLNSERAFAGLKQALVTWDRVAEAPVEEVADAIRPGGIADVKAARIQTLLREVETREGTFDLSRMADLSDAEVVEYLCSLPGVGPKTAACVLLFSMGRPAFPVDTHVLRIAVRLGLVPGGASAEAAHEALGPAVPADLRYGFHMQLIRHGREVCSARRPRCDACVLLDLCESGPGFIAAGIARLG